MGIVKQQLQDKNYDNDVEVYFWDALKTFSIQIPQVENLDINYHTFIEGLKHWLNMESDKAEQVFRGLYLSAVQSDIKHYVALILFYILFYKRDYADIIDLKLNETRYIKSDDFDLVLAFHQFPNETCNFQSNENVLNMELSVSGSPIIETSINGKKKKLWFDTGAQVSVISASTAAECGVKVNLDSSTTCVADGTNFNVGARPAYISSLELGGVNIENHPLIVLEDGMLQVQHPVTKEIIKIEGLLGWNAIQNFDTRIDYRNKTIGINEPVKKSISSNNMFVAGRSVLNLKTAENAAIYLGIDTGASRSSISEKAMSMITEKNVAKELISIASVGGTKQVEARYLENQEFFMGERKRLLFEKMRVQSNFDEWAVFFKIDGVIGSDVTRNSCLHIDCLNGVVEIVD